MKAISCAVAAAALACAGCQPLPKVEFGVSQAPDPTGAYKFTLARSAIKLDYGRSADGKTENKAVTVATVVPLEDDSRVFTLSGRSEDLLSITTISATSAGDTRLLKTVGSDVQSKTQDLIKNVGAIAAIAAPMVLADTSPEPVGDLPDVIDVSAILSTAQPGEVRPPRGRLVNGVAYDLVVAPVPKDAFETERYIASPEFRSRNSVLFYSACRTASLALVDYPSKGKTTGFSLRIADPKFVETIALPAKGSVTFHDSCGVDVAQQRSDAPTGDKLLSELVSQVKAIIDAKNKK